MSLLQRGEKIRLPKGRVIELADQLTTWTAVNYHLNKWSLEELEKLIYLEKTGQNRPRMLARLLARKTSLQKQEESLELGLEAND